MPFVSRLVAWTKAIMRILFVRVRIGVQESGYSYRLYIPFTESSFERQALISVHSDFGRGLARTYPGCGGDRETVGGVRLPLRTAPPRLLEFASMESLDFKIVYTTERESG